MPNNMQSNSPISLALSQVNASFEGERGASVPVLHDITFSVPLGAFVSIAGPSGAGKSTLLRAILGLMQVDSGEIIRNYKRAAMVFQNYALFPWLTALWYVEYGL
jgi:NitT/TauT family transport system ATP-binding protein